MLRARNWCDSIAWANAVARGTANHWLRYCLYHPACTSLCVAPLRSIISVDADLAYHCRFSAISTYIKAGAYVACYLVEQRART